MERAQEQRKVISRTLWAIIFSLAASAGLATMVTGCDTVAEITFIKENPSTLTVLGFHPNHCQVDPIDPCEPPGCGQLQFIMETNRSHFVRPNMQLESVQGRLTPGKNFGEQTDIIFGQTWLFELDTSGDNPASLGLDKTCQSSSDCVEGFECRSFTPEELPSGSVQGDDGKMYCVMPAQITWKAGSLTYTGFDEDPQPENPQTLSEDYRGLSLVINMDNSSTLEGQGEAQTDPRSERVGAIKTFRSELFKEVRSALSGRTEMALLSLNGDGSLGVNDVFLSDQTFGVSFLNDAQLNREVSNQTIFDRAVEDLAQKLGGHTPLWEGLKQSATLLAEEPETYDREVLVFTDGLSDGSTGTNADDAMTALTDDRVHARTQIIHLDSLKPSESYLAELRHGPQVDYDRLACETGGTYIYDVWPESLVSHFTRLSKGYEGLWSIQIEVTAMGQDGMPKSLRQLPANHWYRLAGNMNVSMGGSAPITYRFNTEKANSFAIDETIDRRLLFYVPSE